MVTWLTSALILQYVAFLRADDLTTSEEIKILLAVDNIVTYFPPERNLFIGLPMDFNFIEEHPLQLHPTVNKIGNMKMLDIFFENINAKIQWPLYICLPNNNNRGTHTTFSKPLKYLSVAKIDCYIIFIWHLQMKQNFIKDVEYQIMFPVRFYRKPINTGAKFLLVVMGYFNDDDQTLATNILSLLWTKFSIYNADVLIYSFQNLALNVYTMHFYDSKGHCNNNEVSLVRSWMLDEELKHFNETNFYPNKIPIKFQGCPMNLWTITQHKYDFVTFLSLSERAIVAEIFQTLNFTVTFDTEQAGDVFYGGMSLSEYFKNSHFTYPHLRTELKWYVPCAKAHRQFGKFTDVFEEYVWLAVCLIIILVTLVMCLIQIKTNNLQMNKYTLIKEVPKYLYDALAVTTGVSVTKMPSALLLRIFFLLFVWYSLSIDTIFQAFFTSFLVEPGSEYQISKMDELLNSTLTRAFQPLLATYWVEVNTSVSPNDNHYLTSAFGLIEFCESTVDCLKRQLEFGDIAVFANDIEVQTILSFLNSKKKLCTLDDGSYDFNLLMILNKGSLIERVNEIILTLFEAGILKKLNSIFQQNLTRYSVSKIKIPKYEYLYEKINETLGNYFQPTTESTDDYYNFTLSHMKVAFHIIAAGYLLGFSIVLGEFLHHKFSLLSRKP